MICYCQRATGPGGGNRKKQGHSENALLRFVLNRSHSIFSCHMEETVAAHCKVKGFGNVVKGLDFKPAFNNTQNSLPFNNTQQCYIWNPNPKKLLENPIILRAGDCRAEDQGGQMQAMPQVSQVPQCQNSDWPAHLVTGGCLSQPNYSSMQTSHLAKPANL